jgi:hypothetical protein
MAYLVSKHNAQKFKYPSAKLLIIGLILCQALDSSGHIYPFELGQLIISIPTCSHLCRDQRAAHDIAEQQHPQVSGSHADSPMIPE